MGSSAECEAVALAVVLVEQEWSLRNKTSSRAQVEAVELACCCNSFHSGLVRAQAEAVEQACCCNSFHSVLVRAEACSSWTHHWRLQVEKLERKVEQ